MDIYSLINSKDIRKYLQDIGYEFSPAETAWLIWQNKHLPLADKHSLWKELIDTMSDCRLQGSRAYQAEESLHQFLQNYMNKQKDLIAEFYREDTDWVYQYSLFDSNSRCWWPGSSVYRTFDRCFECLNRDILSEDEDTIQHTIKKLHLDKGGDWTREEYFTAKLLDGKLMDLSYTAKAERESLYSYDFEDMGFSFPVPFTEGDIVWIPHSGQGPFVLTEIGLKGLSYEGQTTDIFGHGDYTDMIVEGYFADSENGVTFDTVWNYMDCEYYDGDLLGSQCVLIPVSNYLKEKISLGLLLQTVHWMLLDEYAIACIPCGYTKEGLRLAGAEMASERRDRMLCVNPGAVFKDMGISAKLNSAKSPGLQRASLGSDKYDINSG